MDDKSKPDKKKVRKALPKLKKLKNTQIESESLAGEGVGAGLTKGINVTCVQACVTACPWCAGQGPGSPAAGNH